MYWTGQCTNCHKIVVVIFLHNIFYTHSSKTHILRRLIDCCVVLKNVPPEHWVIYRTQPCFVLIRQNPSICQCYILWQSYFYFKGTLEKKLKYSNPIRICDSPCEYKASESRFSDRILKLNPFLQTFSNFISDWLMFFFFKRSHLWCQSY